MMRLIWYSYMSAATSPSSETSKQDFVEGFDEIKFLSNSILRRPGKPNLFICGRFHLSAAPNCKKTTYFCFVTRWSYYVCHTGGHYAPVEMMLKVCPLPREVLLIFLFLHFWGLFFGGWAGRGRYFNVRLTARLTPPTLRSAFCELFFGVCKKTGVFWSKNTILSPF